MEKIIISSNQRQLYLSYKEKATNFLEKKIRKSYLFVFLFLVSFLGVVKFIFNFHVLSFLILIIIILSILLFDYLIRDNALKIKKSLKPRFMDYEINFIEYSCIFWKVKKKDLESLFMEQVKEEIKKIDLVIKEAEDLGIGDSLPARQSKTTKKELESFCSK